MPARSVWMAVGAVALALGGCGGEDDRPRPAPAHPDPLLLKRLQDVRDRGDFHSVPRHRRAEARRIIAADRRLADLLGGIGYRVGRMGPWTSGDPPLTVGVLVDLRLDRPLTRDDVWLPAVTYDEHGTSYRDDQVHVRITKARGLTLLVEFARARVVSIESGAFTSRVYPDTPRKPPGEH